LGKNVYDMKLALSFSFSVRYANILRYSSKESDIYVRFQTKSNFGEILVDVPTTKFHEYPYSVNGGFSCILLYRFYGAYGPDSRQSEDCDSI